MLGKVSSIQSLGTVDGPGIRYVIFLSGCNLRCKCCHNPETWDINNGIEMDSNDLILKVLRYKEYFNNTGGLTISGGEPLMQSKFCKDLFKLAHKHDINTCLDTSGCILNEDVKELLKYTDRVLLDIKYTNNQLYLENVGCSYNQILDFLKYLNDNNIVTTIRQVIIPTINDNKNNILKLKELINKYKCVDSIELLPFRKICVSKYQNLNLEFPFKYIDVPSNELMNSLKEYLK